MIGSSYYAVRAAAKINNKIKSRSGESSAWCPKHMCIGFEVLKLSSWPSIRVVQRAQWWALAGQNRGRCHSSAQAPGLSLRRSPLKGQRLSGHAPTFPSRAMTCVD
jgi:hypothetical protein